MKLIGLERDNVNNNGTDNPENDFDLDKILAEVKALNNPVEPSEATETPTKSWSQQDIDRLIAGTGPETEPDDTVFNAADYSIYLQPEIEPEQAELVEEPQAEPLKLYSVATPDIEPIFQDELIEPDDIEPPASDTVAEPETEPMYPGTVITPGIARLQTEIVIEPDVEVQATETVIEPCFEPEQSEDVIEPYVEPQQMKIVVESAVEPVRIVPVSAQEAEPQNEIVIEPVIEPEPETASIAEFGAETGTAPDSSADFDADIAPLRPSEYLNGMETDEARKRFLNVFELEKTAEHDVGSAYDPIEKPGVILDKNHFSKTSDLEPMPMVIPAEEALRSAGGEEKTIVNNGAQPVKSAALKETGAVEGQIVLTGFESEELSTESVSEATVETDLITRRREKAKNFKLVGVPKEGDLPYHADKNFDIFDSGKEARDGTGNIREKSGKMLEFNFPEQRNRIYSYLKTSCKRANIITSALFVIVLIYSAMMALPAILESTGFDSTSFAIGGMPYLLTSFLLLCAAAGFCLPCLVSGYTSLLKLKPNRDAAVALAVTFAAVQNILVIFIPETAVYSGAAAFALLLNAFGNRVSNAGALGNFEFCAFNSPQDIYSIKEIENTAEAFEIGRGILMGEPSILYSCKIGFPSGFVENSKKVGLAETFSIFQVPIASGVAIIAGIISGILAKSFLQGFSVFTGAMCLAVPACAFLSSSLSLRAANTALNADGAMISNQDSADECARSNAVVIDSADLFDGSLCEMHGMKEYKNFRIDDVILYTAAVIIKSGGPLTDIFDKVINCKRDLLPPVKSLSYEDRLGLTAWIHGQKVFLGNRSMLVHHNIDVPPKSDEDKYKHDGRKVMYLAIANKVAAMFVVSYAADSSLLAYIKNLERNGIQLLVRTCDSNITEDLLADCFEMPENYMKVISATAGRIFKRYRDRVDDTAPAGMLHDGSSFSLLKSIATASGLSFSNRIAQIIQTVSIGVGLLGLLVLIFLKKEELAGSQQIILFQAFWALLALAVGFFKRVK